MILIHSQAWEVLPAPFLVTGHREGSQTQLPAEGEWSTSPRDAESPCCTDPVSLNTLCRLKTVATGWSSVASIGPLAQIFENKSLPVLNNQREEAQAFSTESLGFSLRGKKDTVISKPGYSIFLTHPAVLVYLSVSALNASSMSPGTIAVSLLLYSQSLQE